MSEARRAGCDQLEGLRAGRRAALRIASVEQAAQRGAGAHGGHIARAVAEDVVGAVGHGPACDGDWNPRLLVRTTWPSPDPFNDDAGRFTAHPRISPLHRPCAGRRGA